MQKLYSSKVVTLYQAGLLLGGGREINPANQQEACLVEGFYLGRIKFLHIERPCYLHFSIIEFCIYPSSTVSRRMDTSWQTSSPSPTSTCCTHSRSRTSGCVVRNAVAQIRDYFLNTSEHQGALLGTRYPRYAITF